MGPSHTDILPLHFGIYVFVHLLGRRKILIYFNALGFANPGCLREREREKVYWIFFLKTSGKLSTLRATCSTSDLVHSGSEKEQETWKKK